ncbi:leucyl/phenylalanyl-tRNA--protein transferase [Alteromonas lipolytica]|uniref:Leucyl/phenylalanyl-tRNA--protein transferase n=1 Tax=Alteromonas lipolytica TaxID=1856405 RepID=A0A1E8FGC0_9ALTE|nr:leucyl/phenylalanyl-tRNA--protein transferase [Alteromonas lipolytica]OFI34992.1 leucyl/phenylalanyl-tRNA--protein transferase [Alteromonas lipolytica]GGF55701.1 leucyl/phenylalanyl-tRNA--protein transferase [Alteromonas lipolytica]
MISLPYLEPDTPFPPAEHALDEPNGLLAYGADLSPGRLLSAYSQGIFPWFSEGEPLLWWSPSPRAIIQLDGFHTSSSLKKLIRKQQYRVTLNHDFASVIEQCAHIPRIQYGQTSTWITADMINAYKTLHEIGLAHSVEVWDNDNLVGGLYGVAVGDVFCGESMFHKKANTSKLALAYLVKHMKNQGGAFIDCQMPTDHLMSLGAESIERQAFLTRLSSHNQTLDDDGYIRADYQQKWQARSLSSEQL